MSKSFKVILEEHNNWINEARIELMRAAAVKDAFTDNRICELDSDIENLQQDIVNEQDLTTKLKGLLDGRDELLRELVVVGTATKDFIVIISGNTDDVTNAVVEAAESVIAKAQEVLP